MKHRPLCTAMAYIRCHPNGEKIHYSHLAKIMTQSIIVQYIYIYIFFFQYLILAFTFMNDFVFFPPYGNYLFGLPRRLMIFENKTITAVQAVSY